MAKRKSGNLFGLPHVPTLVLSNLGTIAFAGVLALLYIGNAHYAEFNVRRIQTLEREIKELRWTYYSLQSENMYNSLRSEVVESVRDDGLRLHRGRPNKIAVDPNDQP